MLLLDFPLFDFLILGLQCPLSTSYHLNLFLYFPWSIIFSQNTALADSEHMLSFPWHVIHYNNMEINSWSHVKGYWIADHSFFLLMCESNRHFMAFSSVHLSQQWLPFEARVIWATETCEKECLSAVATQWTTYFGVTTKHTQASYFFKILISKW